MTNDYFDDFYNNVLVPLAGFYGNLPFIVRSAISAIVAFSLVGLAFKMLRRVMQ